MKTIPEEMMNKTIEVKEIIDIKPIILKLWKELTGTVPFRRQYIGLHWMDGPTIRYDHYFVTDKIVARGGQSYPLQIIETKYIRLPKFKVNKNVISESIEKSINQLYDLLHCWISKPSYQPYGGFRLYDCCICGKPKSSRYLCHPYDGIDSTCTSLRPLMVEGVKKLHDITKKKEWISTCEYCKNNYQQSRRDSKFCSAKCRIYFFRKKTDTLP